MDPKIASKTSIFFLFFVIIALVFAPLNYSADFASAQIAPNMEDSSDPSPEMQDSIEVINPYYSIRHTTTKDGTLLSAHIIGGPPNPPAEFAAERAVSIPAAVDATILPNFPSYDWVFGCSAVSAAMIAGYYDRGAFPNMYTGPTNGGVMPLSDTSWPIWSDGYDIYPNNPLIASHNGVDGRSTRGSIDDYWVRYNSALTDPYLTKGWTPHTWGTAVGDYMKTSQSAYGNLDGSTSFYTFTSSSGPLTCDMMIDYNIANQDGTYGRKLFYEARGYSVTNCYNQATDNKIAGGFSLANFQAEINAGRPVLLNLAGHSIVGYGYNGSTIYIRDTWDNVPSNLYTMPWGGSYGDMQLQGVSVVHVSNPTPTATPTATATATNTPTLIPTNTATTPPTNTPTLIPTNTATTPPTNTPTLIPTSTATTPPTNTPTLIPTNTATTPPSKTPTLIQTNTATTPPSNTPTLIPTSTQAQTYPYTLYLPQINKSSSSFKAEPGAVHPDSLRPDSPTGILQRLFNRLNVNWKGLSTPNYQNPGKP